MDSNFCVQLDVPAVCDTERIRFTDKFENSRVTCDLYQNCLEVFTLDRTFAEKIAPFCPGVRETWNENICIGDPSPVTVATIRIDSATSHLLMV